MCHRILVAGPDHALLLDCVDDDGAIKAMGIAVLRPEEGGGVVLTSGQQQPVVTAQTPSAAGREPLDTAADIACEVALRTGDTNFQPLEHRKSTDASSRVRHE